MENRAGSNTFQMLSGPTWLKDGAVYQGWEKNDARNIGCGQIPDSLGYSRKETQYITEGNEDPVKVVRCSLFIFNLKKFLN